MNNGVANQATRCFRRLSDAFIAKVKAANPTIEVSFKHVQPRNLGELPDPEVDIVLSSGGPGSPFDGFDDPWCTGYRRFLDRVVEQNTASPGRAPRVLVVCHSFEIAVLHFAVAEMKRRESTKFGVMPAYITPKGQKLDFLKPFGYRLFTWEHRNWEAVGLDEGRLKSLRGQVFAMESHAKAKVNRGDAILGLRFAPGIDGTQFHPEADKPGVMAWIVKPEHQTAVEGAYGAELYTRMVKSLDNPVRLAKTFALFIPGWLALRFNEMAPARGWAPVAPPDADILDFDVAV